MKTHSTKLLWLFSFLFFFSCSNDEFDQNTEAKIDNQQESFIPVCTVLYGDDYNQSDSIETRAVLQKNNKWANGSVITVKFLNGSSFLQNKVKKYAQEWTAYANIKFKFVGANQNADIKIGFKWNGDSGSWSYLGTYCKNIAQNKPSMNFGWFDASTTDTEFSRTILHEFGHALALEHEQQHPTNTIQWNKSVVYAYYAKQGWSKADVDANVFKKLSTSTTNYSAYDRNSIMHYSIDKSFTLNGYSVGWNTILSSTDKNFIAKQYPYPANTKGFYRYNLNSQHLYTSNFEELKSNSFESIMGRVYTTKVANTLPIYRYYNTVNKDRLSTINYNELKNGTGNWKYEGISGYAYKTQQTNTIPVYRYSVGGAKPDHFLTTSNTEVAGGKFGYKSEGIAFHILRN